LDVLRCSITFDRIDDLILANEYFKLFVLNKSHLKEKKVNRISGISRIKNGFIKVNLNNVRYTDLKYNVIYTDCHKNISIMAEVQFIFKPFLIHKRRVVE